MAETFGLEERPELEPRFNIAPTQSAPVVLQRQNDLSPALRMFRWGLVPSWAKNPAIGNRMINARAETVGQRTAYRECLARRRCLVPADGFYEWRRMGRRKQPYYFSRRDAEPFAIAGLWDRWTRAGETLRSFTLLTTVANATVSTVHERMPVLLPRSSWALWLGGEVIDAVSLETMCRPAASELLECYPVSTWVNSPDNDSVLCVKALTGDPDVVEAAGEGDSGPQSRLF